MSYRTRLQRAFEAAADSYRRADARRGFVDKALLCECYAARVAAARDWGDLRGVRLAEIHEFLRRRGSLRKSLGACEPALRRALHDLGRALRPAMPVRMGIRTSGSLWLDVPPGAALDAADMPPIGSATSRARDPGATYGEPVRIEAVAEGEVLRLPAGLRVRSGAKVAVFVAAADVHEEPWAAREFPVTLLERMRGATSMGGDALVDSEAEPG
jgi:hypothetical protein